MPTKEEAKGMVHTSGYVYYSALNSIATQGGGHSIGYFDLDVNTDVIGTELVKHIAQIIPTGIDKAMKPLTLNHTATWFALMTATTNTTYNAAYGTVLIGSIGPIGSGADLEIGEDFIVEVSSLGNLAMNFKPLNR